MIAMASRQKPKSDAYEAMKRGCGQVDGELAQLRTDDAAHEAAGQHQGDRLRLEIRGRGVRGREPIVLAESVVDAEQERADGTAARSCEDAIAKVATMEPRSPNSPPVRKPARRPTRFIQSEAG